MLSANDTDQGILFGDVADNDIGGLFYLHASNAMTFRTNTAERMRIASDGDVTITGSGNGTLTIDSSAGAYSSILNMQSSSGGNSTIDCSQSLRINTNGSQAMLIDSSGNVIAGGTTAQAGDAVTLMQDGEVTAAGFYFSNNIGSAMNDTGIRRATTNTMVFDTASTERMRIDASGNLLVGTTDTGPGAPDGIVIHSAGANVQNITTNSTTASAHYIGRFYSGAVEKGNIYFNGTNVQFNNLSDQRLKDNIVDAPPASDDIDAIQVRSFDWKADGSHQKYGMVAQELQGVAPEAVSIPDDPEEMAGVDYSKLVPMLVKEIQSLRARVQQLENN